MLIIGQHLLTLNTGETEEPREEKRQEAKVSFLLASGVFSEKGLSFWLTIVKTFSMMLECSSYSMDMNKQVGLKFSFH